MISWDSTGWRSNCAFSRGVGQTQPDSAAHSLSAGGRGVFARLHVLRDSTLEVSKSDTAIPSLNGREGMWGFHPQWYHNLYSVAKREARR